jgi:hypothetical protein
MRLELMDFEGKMGPDRRLPALPSDSSRACRSRHGKIFDSADRTGKSR